jgi:hypothetical protein
MPLLMIVTLIAMAAHEANRAYCVALGDLTQLLWDDAPAWQKDSAIAGVNMHLANPDATPEDSHISWLAEKVAAGWVYGPVKDAEKKEHPCCVPYAELPESQKAKDYIFRGVVHATKRALDEVIASATSGVAGLEAALLKATEKVCGEATGAGVLRVMPGETAVTYIHARESYTDYQYGTGLTFVKGQTRSLPGELAQKFLRHKDLFALGDASDVGVDDTSDKLAGANNGKNEQRDEVSRLQDLRDQVNIMNKTELQAYATNNYRQPLPPRASVTEMRASVIGLIDQYGAI